MNEISVHNSELTDKRLESKVFVNRNLCRYFKTFNFFSIYDDDIVADNSILNIPLLATVLPLAWLTGSNIYVETLDKTFKESMDELQGAFKKMYPAVRFTTKINADELIGNRIEAVDHSKRTALLFSGGVDSTYSLLTNLKLKPRLIMFWGTDDHAYPENSNQWEFIFSTYSEFAAKMGLEFHTIKTNVSQILDDKRIEHDFHKQLFDGTLRAKLQHSLVLLPLTAPLSFGRFDRLLIASGGGQRVNPFPLATQPHLDEKIIWADLKVRHDGNASRPEKINGPIRDYYQSNPLMLKVCVRKLDEKKLNDSECEKCLETIIALILAGIDPNNCGFEVDQSEFSKMKDLLKKGKFRRSRGLKWKEFQEVISEPIEYDFYGSKEFLEWLMSIELSEGKNVDLYRNLYNKLPYSLSKILDKFYLKIGIKIHESHPIIPKETSEL